MGLDYKYYDDEDLDFCVDFDLEENIVPEVFKNKFSYFGTCQKTPDDKYVRIVCDLKGKWGCLEDGKDFLFPCQYNTLKGAESALEHYIEEAYKLQALSVL